MKLVKSISKNKTHKITYIVKENGKEVKKEKEVADTYLWLVLDSGVKILITPVKKEDRRILDAVAFVER